MDKNKSKLLKGVMALLIAISHLASHMNELNISGLASLGVIGVSFFFFTSGYGIAIQERESSQHLRGFLQKRLEAVLIPYCIALLMYSTYSVLIGEIPGGILIKRILVDYINGTPIVDNSWYVEAILYFYLVFYCSYRVASRNHSRISLLVLGVLFYILFCQKMGYGQYRINSVLPFIEGVCFGVIADRINLKCFISHNIVCIIFIALLAKAGCYILRNDWNVVILFLKNIYAAAICLVVMAIGQKYIKSNRLLDLIGSCSFEIYLYHGLVMRFMRGKYLYIGNDLMYAVYVILSSIVVALLMHRFGNELKKCITNGLLQK